MFVEHHAGAHQGHTDHGLLSNLWRVLPVRFRYTNTASKSRGIVTHRTRGPYRAGYAGGLCGGEGRVVLTTDDTLKHYITTPQETLWGGHGAVAPCRFYRREPSTQAVR